MQRGAPVRLVLQVQVRVVVRVLLRLLQCANSTTALSGAFHRSLLFLAARLFGDFALHHQLHVAAFAERARLQVNARGVSSRAQRTPACRV